MTENNKVNLLFIQMFSGQDITEALCSWMDCQMGLLSTGPGPPSKLLGPGACAWQFLKLSSQ